jgi:hypothetical protein
MANEGYHEEVSDLSDATRDMHRAITSLMEELEAIDWYNQRVDACKGRKRTCGHGAGVDPPPGRDFFQGAQGLSVYAEIHRPRLGAQDIAVLFAEQEIHAQID